MSKVGGLSFLKNGLNTIVGRSRNTFTACNLEDIFLDKINIGIGGNGNIRQLHFGIVTAIVDIGIIRLFPFVYDILEKNIFALALLPVHNDIAPLELPDNMLAKQPRTDEEKEDCRADHYDDRDHD